MADQLRNKILTPLRSEEYRPQPPEGVAEQLQLTEAHKYHAFRDALRELMHEGRVVMGARGALMLPTQLEPHDEFTGSYRHNKRGFGFVVPTDPSSREDLFIPEGQNNGAITGDIVRAKITSRGQKDGKAMYSGRVTEIIERTQRKFVGSLVRTGHEWTVLP